MWAERIGAHPALIAALRGLDATSKLLKWPSQVLHQAVADHVRSLGLEVAEVTEEQGLWLKPAGDNDDKRVLQAAVSARQQALKQANSTAGLTLPPVGAERKKKKRTPKHVAESDSSAEEEAEGDEPLPKQVTVPAGRAVFPAWTPAGRHTTRIAARA